ncbi:MAG: hypothetical protein HY002_07805 [Candidatus Rokubacteria bacterium]|nr:hypothetical protein [Candidatus Rokubacteria bacterium]
MALRGKGALVIWHGITPEAEHDLIRWHNAEHIPERVAVPGFLRGRRYLHASRPREYLDFYETESVETIRSEPYLARLNDPTPWTQRLLPHFRDTFRIGCRVVASAGRGQGGAMLTGRLRPAPGQDAALRAWLTGPGLTLLREPAGVVGVHVLETLAEVTRVRTAEGKLKGGEVGEAEEPWPLVLLVECTDVGVAEALVRGPLHPDRLVSHGAAQGAVLGTYRVQISIDPE